jgi:ligand-binding sensor domain-containing protein/two-component sensor histidine kinase
MRSLGFLLLALWSIARAQAPPLFFEKRTTENGLSHNKVNCILQDQRGFIWLGTDDGLNRYDGRNFVIFRTRHNDSTAISGNIITDLVEDKAGILWIATADGGLNRYDYRLPPAKQFQQYKHLPAHPASIPTNIINALLEDRFGYLWLATSGRSVLRFDKQRELFQEPIPKGTRTVLDLCLDANGIIWAGREGGGLLKINPENLSFWEDPRYRNLYAKLPHAAVTALYLDGEKNMWFGSWDKVLYRHNTATGKEEVFKKSNTRYSFPNDEAHAFAEDKVGRLWIGGGNGLHLYDKQSACFYTYRYDPAKEGSIPDNRINCIFMDRNGLVWIGTNRGVCTSNPQKEQFVQTFLSIGKNSSPITVYDFYEDAQLTLWIGTSEGLYLRKPDGALLHQPLFYKNIRLQVTHFFKDSTAFYLGTNYSLFRFDPSLFALQLLPNTEKDKVMSQIIDSRVVSVVRDTIESNPVLLVSPYGHFLAYYDLKEQHWVSRLDSSRAILKRFNLKDNLIRKLVKTSDGSVWLATAKMGLGFWKPHSGMPVTFFNNVPGNATSLASNNVFDVVEDIKGNLWVSTYGGGLHYFDRATKHFTQIPSSSNLIEGLQTDARGHVWMISNGNLHRYNPDTRAYTTYTLPDLEKSGGVKGPLFKDSGGRLYVAGSNYFIVFHPDSIHEEPWQPRIFLTDFRVFNKSVSHLLQQKEIRLHYKDNYFTVEFAAPCFSPGSDVQYAYKMEDFDKGWTTVSRNFVSYSNLDGGRYIFKVRASATPGVWSPEYAAVAIVVVPPFWRRPLFFILCTLVISAIVYGLYRYRINELLKRQGIRNKIAQDLHDNVGSTLSSISIYSQVAKIYQQQQKGEDLQQILEKISDASGEMISELNDTVWAINPRNDNMQVILLRMESFARPLLAAKNIALHFYSDAGIGAVNLDMGSRKSFYLIFKEAIHNALKYAECKNIFVTVRQKGARIEMKIKDDGNGFELRQTAGGYKLSHISGGGNGLRNMQHRAKEMNGDLKISSGQGNGTTVELCFAIP